MTPLERPGRLPACGLAVLACALSLGCAGPAPNQANQANQANWTTPAAPACTAQRVVQDATPAVITAYFQPLRQRGLQVVTFLGYSGAGYEDPAAMLDAAARALAPYEPRSTIVNIGATAEGIGAVYPLAKARGYATSGIVSSQARENQVALAACVDQVFYVTDTSWGGLLPNGRDLSPTSRAMVDNSDVVIAIGGGDVARDELSAARRLGKTSLFIPADMNHRIAREKAAARGQPAPVEFGGTAAQASQSAR